MRPSFRLARVVSMVRLTASGRLFHLPRLIAESLILFLCKSDFFLFFNRFEIFSLDSGLCREYPILPLFQGGAPFNLASSGTVD